MSPDPATLPPAGEPSGEELARLVALRHHDPFALLGLHPRHDGQVTVRALLPDAAEAYIVEGSIRLTRLPGSPLFSWTGPASLPAHYRLRVRYGDGAMAEFHDAYTFPPQLHEDDLATFGRGEHLRAWRFLGARLHEVDGLAGVLFATWAPDAERVSVVGDFNHWDGRRHLMRSRGGSGVWELFVPGLGAGHPYKYEIRSRHTGEVLLKTDPYGTCFERRPATAALIQEPSRWQWQDQEWLQQRARRDWLHAPLSIYEVHLGSWRRGPDGQPPDYRELAGELARYAQEMGFTHVELMPVTEYPLDESWGYQATGYFAASSRFGDPDGLRCLVDTCHQHGIGVLLDWVPGHFPRDSHALARYDGTALYEYPDPERGHHPDWGTLVFNYGRNEVRSFLLSSAMYWLEEFHMDGLRVDAVASMIYLDYSRQPGQWRPNLYGSNENLDATSFLRQLNAATHREVPGSLMIAEESTAWPGVSRPVDTGGLGFSMKWNMGWMHDSLSYLGRNPVHRRHHHQVITFPAMYAFSENFVLPLSHDEVVHGKGSLLGRMPGDRWQQFANLRLLLAWQWLFPGKKLLFMGGELGQPWEWDHRGELPWQLAADPSHGGVQQLVRDLNRLHREHPALHATDFSAEGFEWLRWDDADHSTLAFLRRGAGEALAMLLNFTPVPREGYRLGVPGPGNWCELLNSDSRYYGGSDLGNPLGLAAEPVPCMGYGWSVRVTAPPLAAIVLERQREG
jgi:1,4-alpha-glucan branching enzyme